MSDVLLVTCAAFPDGEEGGALLLAPLAARGLSARWVSWDDPAVDWAGARAIAVRSTWDYMGRLAEFLDWAGRVGEASYLLNGPRVFAWNTDKGYLLDLAPEVPVVPTVRLSSADGFAEVASRLPGRVVVKPSVGAGGAGVVVVAAGADLDPVDLGDGPWVVQPVVESVLTEGEHSVFVLGGRAVSQVQKLPTSGEIRVHEHFGGATRAVALTEEAGALALATVEAAQRLLGVWLPYARVDLMRLPDGRLAVSELEVTEPGLYLDVLPENAERFADLVAGLLDEAAQAGLPGGLTDRPGTRRRPE